MMKNEKLISIIIPVYNQELFLDKCIRSLLAQDLGLWQAEILLIDNASEDRSLDLCRQYEQQYPDVIHCYEETKPGVSAARNCGIRHASGRYLFFLDSDDELGAGTLKNICDFFYLHENETDLVTYPIETIFEGRKLAPHFRYQYLNKTGIYDLREYAYIGQTTMNIVVRNRFEKNILFDEDMFFSEDQKYCCEVLRDKLMMGFCSEAGYIYYRSVQSSSGRLSGACYIFEQSTKMFEDIFSWFDTVPLAFQGLFVNDFFWKLATNILFPYHYTGAAYERALLRLKTLLRSCSPEVIYQHPSIDFFEKFYMLRFRGENAIHWDITPKSFSLWHEKLNLISEKSVEMVVTRIRCVRGRLFFNGFLKSVFFQFYTAKPELFVVENGRLQPCPLELTDSAHDYYLSHEPTQRFYAVHYSCDSENTEEFYFVMNVGNVFFPVHYYFMPLTPFSHELKQYSWKCREFTLSLTRETTFISGQRRFRKEEAKVRFGCTMTV